jgi:hypothetical protein
MSASGENNAAEMMEGLDINSEYISHAFCIKFASAGQIKKC